MGLLNVLILAYMGAFGFRLLLPGISPFSENPLIRGLYSATEPILRPIRRLFMRGEPRLDWAPLIVIVLLILSRGILFAFLSGDSPAAGVAGSLLDVVGFVVHGLAILFLGVFFISIDTPFGYSQIGHMLYTVANPFLAPLRLIIRKGRSGGDPAALAGIALLGILHGLLIFQMGSNLQTMGAPALGQSLLWSSVDVLDALLDVLYIAVIIRALVSWFNPDPATPMFQILILYSDPILTPIQRVMPSTYGIDFSPLIAILILRFLQSSVLPMLLHL